MTRASLAEGLEDSIWSLALKLGRPKLAQMLGISVSSLRRYHAGTRSTPDAVAKRVTLIADVVDYVSGSYNDAGTNWLHRNRVQLGGSAPIDVLQGHWAPEDEGPKAVLALARSLLDAGAT